MKKLKSTLTGILNGEVVIADRKKYSVLISVIMFFHMMLAVIFEKLGVMEMVVFNIGSVFVYMLGLVFLKFEKYLMAYILTLLEIILHSFMATLFVGWKYGFALYIIGLVPVGFYVIYRRNNIRKTVIYASLAGVIEFAFYISCYYMSNNIEPIYNVGTSTDINFILALNSIITFLLLIVFMILFTVKISIYQNMLIRKNIILDNIANTDPLTGLHNRRSIEMIFEKVMNAEIPFCIIMCDIDDFKKVNDTYGHEFGDEVLKRVSDTIRNAVRETDYVCRWGGEEILILVKDSDMSEAIEVADRIHRDINALEIKCGKNKVRCTLTMGLSEHKKERTIESTIDCADKKLYEGKQSGKNKFEF